MKINDEVFVYPTDTLYGICASAFSKKAVARIYSIKGRDEHKPFIVLISSIGDLKKFSITLNKEQKTFLNKVWPGKVSVILPVSYKKFQYLHRGTKSLAFRLPKKKSLINLLKRTGPLVAPSANPQGKKPAPTIYAAKKYFGNTIDAYISGGVLEGKPSAIVSMLNNTITIVREGDKPIIIDNK